MEDLIKKEVEEAIDLYEKVAQVPAQRTRNMIANNGIKGALSNLVKSGDLQKGFKALRDAGKLNKTFESIIIKYPNYFESDVVEGAKFRLDNAYDL